MPRDGVRETCAQHHEFVLPLAFRSADCAPDCTIQTAQLRTRTGIHVAHPAHHRVRLIVEIQAVVDQLLEVDVEHHVRTAAVSTTITTIAIRTSAMRSTAIAAPISAAPWAAWSATRAI